MNGNLICKLENLPIKKTLYQGKVHAPQSAISYDLVKLKNKQGDSVDIVSFRKKAGELVRRYIIKKGFTGLTIIERNYQKIKDMLIDNPENPFSRDFLKVTGRKISSVTKLDGDFIEKSEETQTVTHRKNKPNVVHIKKLVRKMFGKNNVETETQSLYEYQKDAPKKGYTVESCFKTRLGLSLDLFSPTYNFENFPKELAKRFEKDPYFLLHLYSDKEFRKFAPACAKHPQHSLAIEPKINWTNRKKASGSYDHDGNIFLNRKKLNNKLKIINTAAHEKEHVFQEEQCIFSAIENGEPYYFLPISEERFKMYEEYVKDGGPYKIHSPKDTDSYWVNMQHYISSDVDLDGYKNQILERHANIAGAIAEEAYAKSSRDLKEEFLYAPDYLIGVTQRESLDRWAEQF